MDIARIVASREKTSQYASLVASVRRLSISQSAVPIFRKISLRIGFKNKRIRKVAKAQRLMSKKKLTTISLNLTEKFQKLSVS